jgi:hypothetical protein
MISYFKTQWGRLLIALIYLVAACYYLFQPAADTTTIEGLNKTLNNMFTGGINAISFTIWMIYSFIDYNSDRIKLLENKIKELEKIKDER